MSLMFSISGLRGLVGKDLSPNIIFQYAAAFGSYIGSGKVILGRDTRKSGPLYTRAVIQGLNSAGCQVIDLGIVPTPTVLFIVRKCRAKGGIAITASHNPVEWNALKFISAQGRFLNREEFIRFTRHLKGAELSIVARDRDSKSMKLANSTKTHIDRIVRVLEPVTEKLRVGVDAVNGAGSLALPRLLKIMGCRVYRMNCKFDYNFPRPPEPRPRSITALCRFVKDNNLDMGVACDPDCDRLAVVDEKGRAIGEDKTLVFATDFLLQKSSGSVVTNLSTTALMDYITKKYNCRLHRTKVGEANVVSKMVEMNARIGGEGNGGVIYPTINFTRDALVAAAIIVKLMVKRNKVISQLIAEYPKYYMQKETLRISKEDFMTKKKKLLSIAKGRINRLDGIRITATDYWIHIRPSQTEPFIRIIGEAKNVKQIGEYIRRVKHILK